LLLYIIYYPEKAGLYPDVLKKKRTWGQKLIRFFALGVKISSKTRQFPGT
jgi:hypothetical protein